MILHVLDEHGDAEAAFADHLQPLVVFHNSILLIKFAGVQMRELPQVTRVEIRLQADHQHHENQVQVEEVFHAVVVEGCKAIGKPPGIDKCLSRLALVKTTYITLKRR